MEEQLTKKQEKQQRKQEKQQQQFSAEKKQRMMKIGVAVVLVLAVVGLIAAVVMTRESASQVKDKTPDPAQGKEDAAVVVRIYEDFQCPACQAVQPVLKDIVKDYGDRVKFIYNDFPLPQHKNATVAAVAAQCALQQNKYFELGDTLFTKQTEWSDKSNSRAQELIRGYAEQAGVDMAAFDTCVTSQAAPDSVNEDLAEGRSLGVNSTPSFFVNDTRVTETPFSSSLRKEIDNALAQ